MKNLKPLISFVLSSALLLTAGFTGAASLSGDVQSLYDSQLKDLFIHFHQNPELSFKEDKTAKRLGDELEALGYSVHRGVGGTGLIALLENGPGPMVMFRADMDGLPVKEKSGLPYASTARQKDWDGNDVFVMHACGHDTHTAILMGVASVLSKHKDKIKGTIKFIFQPAEEGAPPGEEGGASLMVKEGVLENPSVDAIFGLHINSVLPVGMIGYKPLGAMAASDRFVIKVQGKQTHGSQPWGGVDPILISAKIIDGLQTIISRNRNPQNPSVLSICSIHGGNTTNVIPSEVKLMGTFRAMDEIWRFKAHELMMQQAKGLAISTGAEIDFRVDIGYPTVDNEPLLTEAAWKLADAYMGASNVEETEKMILRKIQKGENVKDLIS